MSRWRNILVGSAALSGAAGVAEAAAAAHAVADPLLKTSADFLIVNAAAVIAVSAFAIGADYRGFWVLAAASTLLLGGFLFCGELTAHVLVTRSQIPLMAPIGGILMILGWLAVAAVAFADGFQGGDGS